MYSKISKYKSMQLILGFTEKLKLQISTLEMNCYIIAYNKSKLTYRIEFTRY